MGAAAGPDIVEDGLEIVVDPSNIKGSTEDYDLINGQSYDRRPSFLEPAGNLENFTLFVIFEKTGITNSYSSIPFSKYGGTSAASWRLYHFGDYNGNGNDGVMRYYTTNSSGSWTSFDGSFRADVGDIFDYSLQYSSIEGGQVWRNGIKQGSKRHSGGLKTNGSNLSIVTSSNVIQVLYSAIYNRTLTDKEMINNYTALRQRYGI